MAKAAKNLEHLQPHLEVGESVEAYVEVRNQDHGLGQRP